MRRLTISILAISMAIAAPAVAQAAAAGPGGVRGIVYDATCYSVCTPPCPPPCRAAAICVQRPSASAILCPLEGRTAAAICTVGGCPPTPLTPYLGEGAQVTVHRKGSPKLVASAVPVEGRFSLPLPAGTYAVKAYVSEACWKGETITVTTRPHRFTSLAPRVENTCVAHPDGRSP